MPNYEATIFHEYKVKVEAQNKEEADAKVVEMMSENSKEIDYYGFDIRIIKIH